MDTVLGGAGGTPQPADVAPSEEQRLAGQGTAETEDAQPADLDQPGAIRRFTVNLREQTLTEEVIGGEPEIAADPLPEGQLEPQPVQGASVGPGGVAAAESPSRGNAGNGHRSGTPLSYADIDPVELPRGVKTRVEANLVALEAAQQVEAANRYADVQELGALASYTGWGGLQDIFDETDTSYDQARTRLKAAVSQDAYHTLRASILNAHYTPPRLAEAIWEPISEAAAGRESLRVLEPGSGTGIFFRASGLAGTDTPHQFVGVEVDETTARISSLLHPEAEIHHTGFESTRFDGGSFDLAIGNVPFGDWALPDPRHNTAGLSLHNHFIYKSLAHTAPGGYVAVLTSRYTMDAKNPTARKVLAREGDLVGAVRLPEGAQREVSGTEVGTDVLIFRRRDPGVEVSEDTRDWVETATRTVTDRDGVPHEVNFNSYFAQNPHRVIGEVQHSTNPYGPGYQVRAAADTDVAEQVRAQITEITTTTALEFNPSRSVEPDFSPGIHTAPVPAARYGHVRYNSEAQVFEEYASTMDWQQLPGKQPSKKDRPEILRLLAIRDTSRELIEAQRDGSGAEHRDQLRQRLHGQWESYTETFGPINRRKEVLKAPTAKVQREVRRELARDWVAENYPETDIEALDEETLNGLIEPGEESPVPVEVTQQWAEQAKEKQVAGYAQPHLKALRNDPSLGVLVSVENIDHTTGQAHPAAIMERDIVTRIAQATSADTPEDAIGISMAERGHVDAHRVAELLGTSPAQTEAALEGLVFTDPETERLEPAARYLSGNVRTKLDAAEAAAESEPAYESNVAALRAVVPETIQLEEVTVNPGVPWLDKGIYEQFAAETFGTPVEITYDPHGQNGKWRVEAPPGGAGEDVLYQWGTSHRNVKPWTVLEKTLNSQVFRLTKPDPTDPEKRIADPRGSDAANDKADQLKEHFRTWLKADEDRAEAVQERYNRLFNSIVPADYAGLGEALDFPGLAADRTPYAYQRAAVARALNEPAVLLDHVVGAGKTGSMIMTAMEKRRLGHANKPAVVVPGHLVGQIAGEWKQWYPDAEIMAVPGGLVAGERRELFARAAAGDWDGVVLADTVFEDISIDPARHQHMMSEDIAERRGAVDVMRAEGASKAAIKKAEKGVKTLENHYAKLADKPESGLVFEETGIDFLLVDEAHHYKNLARTSDVPELDEAAGSQRARNLDYILRAMREDKTSRAVAEGTWTPGYVPSVVLFSTGTPVANKVSEMWVMQHYLRPDLLVERGIDDVNAWGATFTEQDWRVIATPDGRYQRALKVTGFANVPEMLAFNRSFQDSVTRADLEVSLPRVIGGERNLNILEASEDVEGFMAELQERVDAIKRGAVDPSEDNVLKVVHEGRMAALDPRLMGFEAPGDGGRPAEVADQIARIHAETAQNTYTTDTGDPSPVAGGLQIVFADLSTPKPEDPGRFTIYDQLKSELVERGIAPEKVAFIHDAAKDADKVELFRKARDGQINVLIGSTQKMGTGMNVQRRAVALHHIDPPWRPADVEQREGRIIRQGNQNEQVEIHAYGTAATTDTFMWSKLSQKAGFIDQLKNPTGVGRTMEDPLAGLDATAANAQAVLSGDPRIGELLTLESEINTLERLEHSHHAAAARARVSIAQHQAAAERYTARLPELRQLAAGVSTTSGDSFRFTTSEGEVITDRGQAGASIGQRVRRAAFIADQHAIHPTSHQQLGTLGGVQLHLYRHLSQIHVSTSVEGHDTTIGAEAVRNNNKSPEGLIRQVEMMVASTENKITKWETARAHHSTEATNLTSTIEGSWSRSEELEGKRRQYEELKADLGYTADDEDAEDAPSALSSEELNVLLPEGLKLERMAEVRDGDVLRVQDGPHGSGYYQARWVEQENRRGVVICPEDGTQGLEEPMGAVPFIDRKVRLAARQRSSLSAMEARRLEARDDPEVRLIRGHELRDGMRVVAARAEGGELITGTVTLGESQHRRETRVAPDGGGESVGLYGEGLDVAEGVLQLNYEPPEAIQRDTDTVSLRSIAHGAELTQDVEGIGNAGDLLVTRPNRHGWPEVHVLDPATGAATPGPKGRATLSPDQFSEPVMLTDQEKKILGAPSPNMVGEVSAADIRPGDQVARRDLDKKAGSGEPVTVIQARGIGSKAHISYREADGDRASTEIPSEAQVRVVDRARSALTVTELAQLHCGVRINDEGNPVPGAQSVSAESLIDPVGNHGVEAPDVIISYTETGIHKMLAGRVAEATELNEEDVSIQVVTSDDDRRLSLNGQTQVTITADPLEISDLNISGAPVTENSQAAVSHTPVEVSHELDRNHDLEQRIALDQQAAQHQPAGVGLN